MTLIHAVVIIATLASAVLCAKTQSCHETLPQLITLCTTVVAGTLGNAMGQGLKTGKTNAEKDNG